MVPMVVMFIVSLAVYKIDGHPITKQGFISRYRLEKLEMMDWEWTLGMIYPH
jgi:hypothetical protein